MGDAQVFPDALGRRCSADRLTAPPKGMAPESVAWQPTGPPRFSGPAFRADRAVISGRVTDDNNEYDEEILLESQLEEAITYFLSTYPRARIVNISLGDRNKVYADGYQTRFAAAIDDIDYRYGERGILIVVSAGNLQPTPATPRRNSQPVS